MKKPFRDRSNNEPSPLRPSRRDLLRLAVLASGMPLVGCGDEPGGAADSGDTGPDSAADDTTAPDSGVADSGVADTGVADTEVVDTSLAEPAQGWPACDPEAALQTVTFVHVNDIHGNFNPTGDGISPVARIRGFVDRVKRENPFTVFTNGGDDFEKGSVAEVLSEGEATIEVVDALRFDVRAIGNHDFAWSKERVLEYSRSNWGPVLCGNVRYTGADPSRWGAVDFTAIDVGCVRVGFFGLVSKPWNERNEQYDGDFYDTEFPSRWDPVEQARELVAAHRAEVDLLVFVSHLGVGTDREVAAAVEGIDVILGAHSHTLLAQPERIGQTLIVQCGSSAGVIGRLDIEFDLRARRRVSERFLMTPNLPGIVPHNERVQQVIESVMARWAPDADRTRGTVGASCDTARIGRVAARAAMAELSCQAAVVDLETVWKSWSAGALTQQDFIDTFKVERQPAGTAGFNAFYVANVRGSGLTELVARAGERYVVAAPDAIDPDAWYRLAVQKILVTNTAYYLGVEIPLVDGNFAAEAWDLLDRFATQRTLEGRTLDEGL